MSAEQPVPVPSQRALIVGLVLAISLHAFEQVAVVAVLDDVVRELQGRRLSGLLFGAYLTAAMLAMVATGQWLDRGRYATSMSVGLVFFAAGLTLATVAGSIYTLLCSRALQGFGGGVLQTVAFGAVNRAFPERERPRVLAYLSQAWVIPGIIGPALAGALAQFWHWRAVFAVVVVLTPVVPVFAVGALRQLDATCAVPSRDHAHSRLLTALFFSGAFCVALVGFSMSHELWLDITLVCGGLVSAAVCLGRLLPPGVLRFSPGLPAAIALLFVVFFAFFGVDSFLPMALKQLHGQGTLHSAVALTPAALLWAGAAMFMARVKQHRERAIRLGFVALGVGVAVCIAIAWRLLPAWVAFPAWGLGGFGIGIVHLGATAVAMNHTAPGEEGATAAAISLVTSLGFALSTALLGALIAAPEPALSTADSFAAGWAFGFLACVLGALSAGRLGARASGAA